MNGSLSPSPAAGRGSGLPRWASCLLWLLLVGSLAIRLWLATVQPDHRRAYDERFGVRNVAHILETGRLRPENGFHPSLAFLPHLPFLAASQVLFLHTGKQVFRIVDFKDNTRIGRPGAADGLDFTPTGYRVARGVNCLIGVLSIYLCFVTGARMFDWQTGLTAAWLLSAVPWHVRQSAVFKPDIVLVTTGLLALYLALSAFRRRRIGDYLLAGAAVGLALSSKFNAPPAALPLVLAAVLTFSRDRRSAAKLLLAGAAALAVLVALNPWLLTDFELYATDFGATLKDYGKKARRADATSLDIMRSSFTWLSSGLFHGWVLALAALAGAVTLVARVCRGWSREPGARERLLLPGFVVGYVLLYSLASRNPLGWHNWLVLTPATSILAAWTLVGCWRLATRALSAPARRWAAITAAVVMAGLAIRPALVFAYQQAVPTTADLAAELAAKALRRPHGRVIISEVDLPSRPLVRGRRTRIAVQRVDRLSRLDTAQLDAVDAEILRAAALEEPETRFYEQRLERLPARRVHRFERAWLRARGGNLILLTHPWRSAGRFELPLQAATAATFRAALRPPDPRAELVSVGLWLPRRFDPSRELPLSIGDERPDLIWLRKLGNGNLYLSERAGITRGSSLSIGLRLDDRAMKRQVYPVEVHLWRSRAR